MSDPRTGVGGRLGEARVMPRSAIRPRIRRLSMERHARNVVAFAVALLRDPSLRRRQSIVAAVDYAVSVARGFDRTTRRKLLNYTFATLTGLTVLALIYPLVDIVYQAVELGGTVLFQPGFLTALPPNACSQISCSTVGIGPDIEGTLILVGLASLIAVPIGVLGAIYASEYRGRGFGRAISFTADVMTGIPSIIMGVFVYYYFVLYDPTLTTSTITGALALSALMTPIVLRTTEEALRVVPNSIREAALALGMSKWKTTLRIVLVTSLPGVLTGILLAVMRAAGEAAPLLFTAGTTLTYFQGVDYPTANLPYSVIFEDALSPYSNLQKVAWGATLFLLLFILIVNVLARYTIHRMARRMGRA